jgi:hypothetical protein
LPPFHLQAACQVVPAFFRRVPPKSDVAISCWKAHCWLVRAVQKMMVHVSKYAGTRAVPGDGNPPRFCLECRCSACATHHRSCLTPFPVPCPGATRYCTALLCYACCVAMGSAAHSGPSASLPCTCRFCAGKMQGKVDVLVGTTHIPKLSCCQDVIVPLS